MNNTTFNGGPAWPPGPPVYSAEVQEMIKLEKDLRPMFYTFTYIALIVTFIGNGLIVVIVLFDRQSRSMANLFLFNISIADVIYAALNLVGESLYVSWEDTPHKIQANVCPLTSLISLRFLTYAVSMLSMAALSIERYHAVCKPLTTYTNIANINILKIGVFVFIWLAAIAISVPLGLCPFEGNHKAFGIALVLLLHTIPLLIIIITNTAILVTMKSRVGPGENTETRDGRGHRRLTTLLILMVVTFLIFWSPYHVLFLYPIFKRFQYTLVNYVKLVIVKKAANVLAYINPALNPVLYMIYSKNFRQGLYKMIHCDRAIESNPTASTNRSRAATSRQTALEKSKVKIELKEKPQGDA